MKRILFVDDEQPILDGLQNVLRKQRKHWNMEFALGGVAALEALKRQPHDVVVSDMRMPGMDGAQLFERMRVEHPDVARVILSGHAEREAIIRASSVSHQFLSKPCDVGLLESVVTRICGLQDRFADAEVRTLVGSFTQLPSPPSVFFQLQKTLASPNCTAQAIGEVMSQDAALAAKILQIVNSGYFGLPRTITSITQAVSMVGVDLLKALAVSTCMFKGPNAAALQRESMRVAEACRPAGEQAYTAGLLHNIGSTVSEALAGQCGAYLLGMWGLPAPIVEAVAFSKTPELAHEDYRALATTLQKAITGQ